MIRVALHSVIAPGATQDYVQHHAQVPADLVALFDRAGIANWTIWRSGDRLFHLVECQDFDRAMRIIRADAADERWQADIGRFVTGFFGPDGEPEYAPLHEVWQLQEQVEAGR